MVSNDHLAVQLLASRAKVGTVRRSMPKVGKATTVESGKFQKMLHTQKSGELTFSKHAQKRLASRNIELSGRELESIKNAVDLARKKGSRDSLVLMKDLALVVSVKNSTVITAVNDVAMNENIFTNIDSAVIAH